MYSNQAGSQMGSQWSVFDGGNNNKSSMIEQEMRAIRRIKEKQKKEVEQMIDYEMKMNQIREKNEHNLQLQREKEQRMKAELMRKRALQEQKKAEDEAKKIAKAEAEQAAIQRRTEQLRQKELEQLRI